MCFASDFQSLSECKVQRDWQARPEGRLRPVPRQTLTGDAAATPAALLGHRGSTCASSHRAGQYGVRRLRDAPKPVEAAKMMTSSSVGQCGGASGTLEPARQVSEPLSGLRQLLQRAPASSELYGEGCGTEQSDTGCLMFVAGPDSTFRHPFVKEMGPKGSDESCTFRTQELLLRAQARVSWEPWVICVRSYARSTVALCKPCSSIAITIVMESCFSGQRA